MDRKCPASQVRLACRLVTAIGVGLAVCAAGWASPQPGNVTATASSICQSPTHPVLAARLSNGILAALRGRASAVGLTVDDRVTRITCKLHPNWHMDSASVVKVTILSALLRKLQVQQHSLTVHLTAQQQRLATAMITKSDNNAASALWAETG